MIPDKFFKAALPQPTASTVGQLKQILAELPDDLAVTGDFGEEIELIVFNHGTDEEHLEIRTHA
jgi:hypothetical protein